MQKCERGNYDIYPLSSSSMRNCFDSEDYVLGPYSFKSSTIEHQLDLVAPHDVSRVVWIFKSVIE